MTATIMGNLRAFNIGSAGRPASGRALAAGVGRPSFAAMRHDELEILRRQLIERLAVAYSKTERELDGLAAAEAFAADPGDDADESVEDEGYSYAAELDDRDIAQTHAIERALRAMQRGEYGRCVDCGREIPFERLRAVPWADRCADDQERLERAAGAHPPTL
jgi:DnaK suppressor protein